jgi:RNA polymerase sigma-70 factor (ECF subfamily)
MREKQSHFEEVLLPHLDGAYNLARWLIGSDQDARPIVQEACLQARREFAEFREADVRNWLLTIVCKTAHTWIEKHDQRSKIIPFAEAFPATSSSVAEAREDKSAVTKTVADKLVPEPADQEWRRALYEALSRLRIESREVLVLHDIEGFTYTQLASMLEIPRATVLQRLSMARRNLRQELGQAYRRELNEG